MKNILDNLEFSSDKANVFNIRKTEKVKYFAVALGLNAVLKKHKTSSPATLVVLKGEINFVFSDREYLLKQFDTFEIPVDEEHEVVGVLEQNLFTVNQEI